MFFSIRQKEDYEHKKRLQNGKKEKKNREDFNYVSKGMIKLDLDMYLLRIDIFLTFWVKYFLINPIKDPKPDRKREKWKISHFPLYAFLY